MKDDYRSMFGKPHLGAWDLEAGDATLTISKAVPAKIKNHQAQKEEPKILISFEETKKTFICNITNAKTIAGMYGKKTSGWIGKKVTLFGTTTSVGGETKDCIRIRPTIPKGKADTMPADPEPETINAAG